MGIIMEGSKKVLPNEKLERNGGAVEGSEPPAEKATEEELKDRKIVTIKGAEGTEKAASSVFGAPSTGLFGAAGDNKKELFGGLFSGKLFSQGVNNSSLLFSNVPTTGGIFGAATESTGLFGAKASASFLNSGQNNNDESDGGDDAGDGKSNEPSEDEEEIKKRVKNPHKYETFFDEIIKKEIQNYKVDDKDPLGPGSVTIERSKENSSLLMVAMRTKTKNILHSCMLLQKLSTGVLLKGKPGVSFFGYIFEKNDETKKPEEEKEEKEDKEDKEEKEEKESASKVEDASSKKEPKAEKEEEPTKKTQSSKSMKRLNVKVLFGSVEDAKEFLTKLEEI